MRTPSRRLWKLGAGMRKAAFSLRTLCFVSHFVSSALAACLAADKRSLSLAVFWMLFLSEYLHAVTALSAAETRARPWRGSSAHARLQHSATHRGTCTLSLLSCQCVLGVYLLYPPSRMSRVRVKVKGTQGIPMVRPRDPVDPMSFT